jgi:hypothetical protein
MPTQATAPGERVGCLARRRRQGLWTFFLLTYLALLLNMSPYLWQTHCVSVIAAVFAGAVFVTYPLLFLLPVMVPVFSLERLLSWGAGRRSSRRLTWLHPVLVCGLAILGCGAIQVFLTADATVYRMFRWHLNGYVWVLLTTPGGIESMEMGSQAILYFALLIAALVAGQAVLLLVAVKVRRLRELLRRVLNRPVRIAALAVLFAAATFQALAHAVSDSQAYAPILRTAEAFPLYLPLTMKEILTRLGLPPAGDNAFRMKTNPLSLQYPLHPLNLQPVDKPCNLVMLVAESWRADMVDPNIMPATWAFAHRASWFRRHYSGGHETRMALFGMFYGLYGPYWFAFKDECRGPALLDVLRQRDYQMFVYSTMTFTYPEFDRTIFASLPKSQLHVFDANGMTWQRDRQCTSRMLAAIEARDRSRPFFAFMFFDSPHARYYFPDECAIRKPYLETVNYATLDTKRDIGLIRNRYVNACNHLDTQLQRVLAYLESKGLLDSTVILVAGDHGEQFMEQGHWGHAGGFEEGEIRTPLILHVPGRAPQQVTRMTSHLDVPATLLPLLGVTNPAEDYSFGHSLLGPVRRDYAIASGWDTLAYVDSQYKVVFPLKGYSVGRQIVKTADDVEVQDAREVYSSRRAALMQVLRQLGAFSK